jgi:hypothetical protein
MECLFFQRHMEPQRVIRLVAALFIRWEKTMTIVVNEAEGIVNELSEPQMPRAGISWAAVLAGAAVTAALTLLLLSLGVGLGASVVSPWGGSGVSATTFKVGTGLYLIVIAMIASGLGGHITGRLRHRYIGIHDNEVYFRDTANGFVAWAVSSIVGAALLASAASGLVGGATTAATAAGQNSVAAPYVDKLLRADAAAPAAQNGPNSDRETRRELNRLLGAAFRERQDIKPDDRTYVAQLVTRQTGLSPADAQKRVDNVINEAKTDLDAARKATLQLALWLTASLFLGAFASSIAAAEGGAIRDRNWGTRSLA